MNVVNENHLLGIEHAHDTAARGWPVVPYLTRPDGVQLRDWPNIATTDPEQIDAWFGKGQPYEGCYVATIPGLVNRTVVDIDAHPGKPSGFETAARLRLPTNAMVSFESASGAGKHMWYVGNTSSKAIYPGIDRKSLKALVRVPYLLPPVEDVFESLPMEYQIQAGSTTGIEFLGDISEWMELYSRKA